MAVNVKLILAESLRVLKLSEEREAQTDRELERMTKSSTRNHDFPKIKRMYSTVYDSYIRGLELMNFCRRSGIDSGDGELANFGAEKMNYYMDRCEKLRAKENNVLTSVEQADNGESMMKEGYSFGEYLFVHQRKQGIKGSQPVSYTHALDDGSYYLQVKNYDDYNVAAPTVRIQLQLQGRDGRQVRQQKIIPSRCCWGKYIGVVTSGTITFSVITDAMLRESHVEVTLRQLLPPKDAQELKRQLTDTKMDASWVDTLPVLPSLPLPTSGVPGAVGQPGTTLPPPEGSPGLPPAYLMAGLPNPDEAAPTVQPPPPAAAPAPAPAVKSNTPSNAAAARPEQPIAPPAPALASDPTSETQLLELQVPGGSVGSPVTPSSPDQMDQLQNLRVPYRDASPVQPASPVPLVPQPASRAPAAAPPPPYPVAPAPGALQPVVTPKDMTPVQRAERLRAMIAMYQQYVTPLPLGDATKLPAEQNALLNAIDQLPGPTELGSEGADEAGVDLGNMALDVGDIPL